MLSFRVEKKIQPDVLVVDLRQSNETTPNTSRDSLNSSGAQNSQRKVMRILTLDPRRATAANGTTIELEPKAREKLLKELSAFNKTTAECPVYFCRPHHASVQDHDNRRRQLHLFLHPRATCGISSFSLDQCRHQLPQDEETMWRLLSTLCYGLHALHFAAHVDAKDQTADTVGNGRCFFTYYGTLSSAHIYVHSTQSGDPNSVPNTVSSTMDRPHRLHFTLDLPTSIMYHEKVEHAQDRKPGRHWAAMDIQAAGKLVMTCLRGESLEGYSQEFRFLVQKLCAPEATQRPTAAQILNFQAIALRQRVWSLETQVDLQRETIQKLDVGVRKGKENRTDHSSPVSDRESDLRRREWELEQRERKMDLFMKLYNITASQLDPLPSDPSAAASAQREYQQHLSQHISHSSPSLSVEVSPAEKPRPQSNVIRSPEYENHRVQTPCTPPQRKKEASEISSPQISPLPKASEYGSEDGDGVAEPFVNSRGQSREAVGRLDFTAFPPAGAFPSANTSARGEPEECELIVLPDSPVTPVRIREHGSQRRGETLLPAGTPPLTPYKNDTGSTSKPTSEKKRRSPSAHAQKLSADWMRSHLSEIETLQKELHDTSHPSVCSVGHTDNASNASADPITSLMLDLAQKETGSSEALAVLRTRIAERKYKHSQQSKQQHHH